ncbi:uncharacterized protein LOC119680035 isoform X2 [Teleopsis dalmanni]|uniref:uncharacterized protein LOC119680035 isoform X2 n=1 Tax=Teleopsis dalmanni TaxID=139649 RepID=UPI0018CDF66C|nr:uncharacterized protein LOC119680035 isoform X2 [Teleopsis dalmanni]
MSEKNVQSAAQWTKATATAANTAAAQKLHAQGSINLYDHQNTAPIPTQSTLYVGNSGTGHPAPYVARFQTPLIHHASAPPPSLAHNTPTLLSTSSNVPAPSGFVPPSYSPATVAAAATSVLTPNPFAINASGNSGSSAFGLDQFILMNAATAVSIAGANATGTTVTSVASMPLVPNNASMLQQQTVTNPNVQPITITRQHGEMPSASSGVITSTIVENVINAISNNGDGNVNVGGIPGRLIGLGVKTPDDEKLSRVHNMVESSLSDQAKQQIAQILDRISTLKPVEKLLLYLRLPGEAPDTDPLRHPQNPLGTRSEINHTINWVRSHLEHDPQVSIPKQDVYNDYQAYCERLNIKPLSTADFGKVMKQVFPGIRPRRLGTRGNSRYCYAAMRKTTKLAAPQLPQMNTNISGTPNTSTNTSESSTLIFSTEESDTESWNVIKKWAEKLLNVRVDGLKDLAERIKGSNILNSGTITCASRANVSNKKYTAREPKEKRLLNDMGPLKKRRKKKRKGSSSSESSCNQSQGNQSINNNNNSNITNNNKSEQSPKTSNFVGTVLSDDEQKFMVKIKQEIIDSPNIQHAQQLPLPQIQNAAINTNYIQSTTHQVLPINLATEQRTVLAKAPPSDIVDNQFGGILLNRTPMSAVKNLTPKIIEMSAISTPSPANTATTLATQTAISVEQIVIKEEVVDDYNPTNVFCKKVRKAQQTKGFWINSPTPNNNSTITLPSTASPAASPATPNSISVIATPNIPTISVTAAVSAAVTRDIVGIESPVTNYLMGPPAQISNNASTSPSISGLGSTASTDSDNSTNVPKVASRNMQLLLRAKKQAAAADANNSDMNEDKDTELPENLGLPRERVISICNMDKRELDDYFLPDEEDNSQDQDTELLQYFQPGDAEEKVNSSDAVKTNPMSMQMPTNEVKKTTLIAEHSALGSSTDNVEKISITSNRLTKIIAPNSVRNNLQNTAVPISTGFANAKIVPTSTLTLPSNVTTTAVTIGSASASLALMSQKHQEQKNQHINFQNKRKISLNTPLKNSELNLNRKNCIFLPISPNTNNATLQTNTTNSNFFASPGLTRLKPKPALVKQQSLDCGSSDPMIGASRRKRTYATVMPNNTSASAPPSPSVLQQQQQQQQQQQLIGTQQVMNNTWLTLGSNCNNSYNDVTTANNALLSEQDSLDLDLFGTVAGDTATYGQNSFSFDINTTAECQLTPLNEMQRSQSVPLSHLQRTHSPVFNRNGFHTNYSTCTSVAQTPVPHEFTESTMFSENSCSQHSNTHISMIKLEESTGIGSDTTTVLSYDVDVNDILSSPDFVASIAQASIATTTCSSAGSSSGYSSSGTCTTFGITGNCNNSTVSRSVPSTPLPHHQQNLLGNNNFYSRRLHALNDEINLLSPNAAATFNGNTTTFTAAVKCSGMHAARSVYDISKSMPTTPITTTSFRYSPTEYNRDFLINGNSIDISTFGAVGTDNLIGNVDASEIDKSNETRKLRDVPEIKMYHIGWFLEKRQLVSNKLFLIC